MSDHHDHDITADAVPGKILDHNYDGIQEYDNPMPGWWVWLFILTSIFAVPYIMWYHMGKGPSIHDKFESELAVQAARIVATFGELTPDEATIMTYMANDDGLRYAAGIFQGKCATCHASDASGSTGPNLTDDHWINVRSLEDVADVIINGRKGTMPAWKDQYSTTELVLVTAYIASLRDNPVPGKSPEPDAIEIDPWPTVAAPASGGDT